MDTVFLNLLSSSLEVHVAYMHARLASTGRLALLLESLYNFPSQIIAHLIVYNLKRETELHWAATDIFTVFFFFFCFMLILDLN